MTFNKFTEKLATIQADEYLTVEDTMLIKRKVVGMKKLHECTEKELNQIVREYRKEYKRKDSSYEDRKRSKKSKNKYTTRKDWD
jgi:hypothetical protein|tara:strand:+ start:277 stop:528 length:252 start_codon:yes stop_codon:yes gene_type:complete